MPLFSRSGLDALDYTPGAIRTETSDALLASLLLRPNFVAALPIGQYGGGGQGLGAAAQATIHTWVEDRLNPRSITVTNALDAVTNPINATVTAADGAVVDIGYVLMDTSQNTLTREYLQVVGITPGTPNTTLSLSRSYGGTPISAHVAATVFGAASVPVIPNSDLGRDMSRSPIVKTNFMYRQRRDVNISADMIGLAQHNMAPGIISQLGYQLHQRFLEGLIDINNAFIHGIGTPAATTSDYQTMHGLLTWLGMESVLANTTAVTFNANQAPISDVLINQVGINLYNQGAEVPDVIVVPPIALDRIARIYRDQLRLTQEELVRGYFVDAIRISMGTKPVRLIVDGYMPAPVPPATTPQVVAAFVSLDRMALIPFLDQMCYLISAPSFRDGDAMSIMFKVTFEPRNTGTDSGFGHQALYNFAL